MRDLYIETLQGLKAECKLNPNYDDSIIQESLDFAIKAIGSQQSSLQVLAEKTKKEIEQADVSRVNEYVNNFKPKPDKKRKINNIFVSVNEDVKSYNICDNMISFVDTLDEQSESNFPFYNFERLTEMTGGFNLEGNAQQKLYIHHNRKNM
ncbi:MAG: hypothetical protein UFA98_07915 [Ruminococcus sp.]|nr:hypothetical protein [Ruminococcus sp.]